MFMLNERRYFVMNFIKVFTTLNYNVFSTMVEWVKHTTPVQEGPGSKPEWI